MEVLIVDAKSGAVERVITAPFSAAPLGGRVSTLSYDDAVSGRLTFGISSAGTIVSVDPDEGELEWLVDFGGGNPADLGMRRTPGSRRGFTFGMTDMHAAAFVWESGERLTQNELHGFTHLGCTSDDEITVGVQHGRLTFLDSVTYEPLWLRTELAAPLGGSVAAASR